MKIGLIGGAGGQADRLLSYKIKEIAIEYILYDHHGETLSCKKLDQYEKTNRLEDLLFCSGVIIMSPNTTHYFYLKYFIESNYKGYIYCEKPPVDDRTELNFLMSVDAYWKNRILFGFNLQRSIYRDILEDDYGLGNLQYCNIISGHGLGFKEHYSDSWRNKPELLPQGIFRMVIIHYLELFISRFGLPKGEQRYNAVRAPKGRNIDNCMYSAVFGERDIMLNIYASYTMPLMDQSIFVFDNGYIIISENRTEIFAPRDSFDEKGGFKKPEQVQILNKGTSDIWKESLQNNILYFYKTIIKRVEFSEKEYDNSLIVNEYILNQ